MVLIGARTLTNATRSLLHGNRLFRQITDSSNGKVTLDDFLEASKVRLQSQNNNSNRAPSKQKSNIPSFFQQQQENGANKKNKSRSMFSFGGGEVSGKSTKNSDGKGNGNGSRPKFTFGNNDFEKPANGRSRSQPQRYSNSKQRASSTTIADLFPTGTRKDKEAALVIIRKSREVNKKGTVCVIQPDGQMITGLINKIVESLNLDNEGLSIIRSDHTVPNNILENGSRLQNKGVKGGEKCCLLKVVDSLSARKAHSDHLAEVVTKTVNWGSRKMQNLQAAGSGNTGGANALEMKVIRVSWEITINDLLGQKRHELMTQLKKGYGVQVVLDYSDNFTRERRWKFDVEKITDLERTRMTKVMGMVEEFITESECSFESEGKMGDKVVYSVKPPNKRTNDKEMSSKNEAKNLKKQEKLEKQRLKAERAKAKAEAQAKEIKMISVDDF